MAQMYADDYMNDVLPVEGAGEEKGEEAEVVEPPQQPAAKKAKRVSPWENPPLYRIVSSQYCGPYRKYRGVPHTPAGDCYACAVVVAVKAAAGEVGVAAMERP